MNWFSLIELKSFSVFPEYFIDISTLYILFVSLLISYSVYGLIIQKSISGLILLPCFFIINGDLFLNVFFIKILYLIRSFLLFSDPFGSHNAPCLTT